MKKVLVLIFSLFVAFFLVACGETEEAEIDNVSSSDNEDTEESAEVEGTEGVDAEDEETTEAPEETEEVEESAYDEVLLDDENATVTLKGIETVSDDIFGDEHNIKMEIENKSDGTIIVQSREVSIDGFMVDDMVMFSETVAAGKKANGSMDIMAFDEELPELNENIEFILLIADEETFMDISTADVSVDIN